VNKPPVAVWTDGGPPFEPAQGISIKGLVKSFADNQVLKGIDLDFRPGQITGLMGANGAGKSTLIKILDGIYSLDDGTIKVGGTQVRSLANRPDVGFIHQDLGLIDQLSVSDNLRLGGPPVRRARVLLDREAERRSAAAAIERLGLTCPVDALVRSLSPGEKTLVAAARVLDRGVRTLFVDEATSTLPPADAKRVIGALSAAARGGACIVMVTHKLAEILDSTDRVIVLVDGVVAEDAETQNLDREALVKMLLAHDVAGRDSETRSNRVAEPLLRLQDVTTDRVGSLDLSIFPGEVLGLTGRPGSGLHDIAFLAAGYVKPSKGKLVTSGPVRPALVPPHRETQGGFLDLDVLCNMSIASIRRYTRRIGLIHRDRERLSVGAMSARLSVRPADPSTPYGVLSGGNKQKVVTGRALLQEPNLVVLCEPTRGVDVGTRADIYALIRDVAASGAAVLITTSDAEDLFTVCDRIGVVEAGRVPPPQRLEELSVSQIEELV
jgi:ribose transport system ATP-binding protein